MSTTQNIQSFTEKLSAKLDEAHVQDMVTGFLTDGSLEAEFASSDTVLIPEYDMSGLGDYSRQSGYPVGGIGMRKRPYTLQQERGRMFDIDKRDLKTNDIKDACKTLGVAMTKFQKTKVDPEVDAFNLATIASRAIAGNVKAETFTADSADLLKRLIYDVDKASEFADGDDLFVFFNWSIHGILSANTEFNKLIDIGNFKKGTINTELKTINDAAIVKTPRSRMYTQYDFFNGVDTEQKPGGFAPTADAKPINWIILPRSAAACITVMESSQLRDPSNNPKGDFYSQGYRRLYGAFVKEGNTDRIVVSHA
jgi:hypothetical protein